MANIARLHSGSNDVPISVKSARHWHWHWHGSTPGWVRGATLAAVALAVAMAALAVFLFGRLHGEFDAIGRTDEPGAISTTSLYFYLTDMDASSADVLLVGGDTALTTAGQSDNR